MSDTLEIVNRIRAFGARELVLEPEDLAELARQFARACRDVNDRAAQCRELLRKGMRPEAVRAAKAAPGLREQWQQLNFGEIHLWLDACEKHSLELPQALEADLGELVEELYAETETLDRLLRVYRRMALGKAPLSERLRILRRIRQLDSRNAAWEADLRLYETARMEELASLADVAAAQQDLPALEAVQWELRNGDWLERPGAKFVQRVDQLVAAQRRRWADAQFAALVPRVYQAHGAMDEAICRTLLAEWVSLTARSGLHPSAAMAAEVEPTQAWLAELERAREEDAAFEHACASLEAALEDGADLAALERLAAAVLGFERNMPELLAARLTSRTQELQRRAGRKFTLTLTGVIAAMLLIGAGIALAVVWQQRRQAVLGWQEQVASLLGRDDLEGAAVLLERLAQDDPRTLAAPELQKLQAEYRQKSHADADRCLQWQAALATVEQAGLEQPDAVALTRAGLLARTFEEKSLVENWRQRIETRADELRQHQAQQFQQRLAAVETKFAAVRVLDPSAEQFEANCQECIDLAGELARSGKVSDAMLSRARAVHQAALQLRQEAQRQTTRRQGAQHSLEQLATLASDADRAASALAAFAQEYPEHPYAASFSRALTAAPAWQACQAWQHLSQPWGGRLRVTDAAVAAQRLSQVEAFLKDHPAGPQQPAVAEYRRYLQACQRARPDGKREPRERLAGLSTVWSILQTPLLAEAFWLRTNDGQAYYLPHSRLDRSVAGSEVVAYGFRHFISASGRMTSASLRPALTDGTVGPAPQTRFVAAAVGQINAFRGDDWETLYLGLAQAAQAEAEMDPVLTATLLKLLLNEALKCAAFGTEQVRQMAAQLDDLYLDVPWMDPASGEAAQVRTRAAKTLANLQRLEELVQSAQAAVGEMEASLAPWRAVGIVLGEPADVRLSAALPDGTDLWAVQAPADGAGAASFRTVGSVQDGKAVALSLAQAPMGTLVFARGQ